MKGAWISMDRMALGLGAASALAVGLALLILSRAPGEGARIAAVEAVAREAQQGRSAGPALYAPLCREPLARAETAVITQLRLAAGRANLAIQSLDAASAPEGLPADLAGAELRLRATGSEMAVAGFLSALGRERLPVYPEAADIKRAGASLSLDLTARLLCRRSTP